MNRFFFLVLVIALATGGYVFANESANPAASRATAGRAAACDTSGATASGSHALEGNAMACGKAGCANSPCQKRYANAMMAQNRPCPMDGQADDSSDAGHSGSRGRSCPMMGMR